jgi:hypothetical protein
MEKKFNGSKPSFEEAVLIKLDDLKQSIDDIRRDLHIQILSANTKLDHSNHQTNGTLNGFAGKIDKMAKDIEEIKQSTK